MGTDLIKCNPALARRILAQMQAEDAGKLRPIRQPEPVVQKPKAPQLLRQNKKGPNKLEAAFAAVLRAENPGVQIREQAVTLLLANGVRYTPDMFIMELGRLEAFETKGHMRDDAAVKIKIAAAIWPQITFWLVWRKAGVWHRQRILA
jgi:hypothetical protein